MTRFAGRGQILPLFGLAAVVLIAVAGFAADAGFHQYEQRMQQTATDSAALAGAEELMSGSSVAAARADAATNGFADNTGGMCPPNAQVGNVCVQVYNPPQAPDPFSSNGGAVEVDITAYHPTFFERLFNIQNVPVTTKAVAVLKVQNGSGCIYALDTQHTANFNGTASGGAMYAPNCGLELNGGANFNNAIVDAAAINCAATCANGTFIGAQPATTAPIADPCPQIAVCAYLTQNPPNCSASLSPPVPDATGSVTLPAGCYNGFTYHNSAGNPNLRVDVCGLYVVTNTADISSTGTGVPPITIEESPGCPGVTFYVTGNGAINFRNANMTLNAPPSGDYSQYVAGEQNMVFYQTPTDTNTVNLQSATCMLCASTISGMMYFPTSNVNYTKSIASLSGSGALLVSYDLNCNGCLASAFPAPAPGLTEQRVAVLGE